MEVFYPFVFLMLSINWPQSLSWRVKISGSKNAALPLIAACLFHKTSHLENVPRIGDIFTFIEIIKSLGWKVKFEWNTLDIDTSEFKKETLDKNLVKKIRASILLFPALLARFGSLEIPHPGGCVIGKRPVWDHVRGLEAIGYTYEWTDEEMRFSWTIKKWNVSFSAWFAVTATESLLIANAWRTGVTTIHMAAIEPHVVNLIDFLRNAGTKIDIAYDHTITIEWKKDIPETVSWKVIHDYIESGTFVILGALTAEPSVTIEHARIADLGAFLEKCHEAGVRFDTKPEKDEIIVYNSRTSLHAITLQTNVFPWFPTDLQSPFALLLSQAEWISRIHEVMFEGRLNWLIEIEKMKGHIAILNPHEALIFGKTHLKWTTVSSWDLRAWVTMIIAGMIARGETLITNVEYIERGYENIVSKIEKLGGKIENK
jgi:UDP-N-acetylglucosamine 1-carboxyvinyltransferase